MKLSRLTPASKIEIKAPIWNTRSIGVATFKIGTHNEIHIKATGKDGQRLYPAPLYISGEKARQYPVEPVRSNPNIKLHIIPINELEPLERV